VHAQPRATKDLDLWVSPERANAAALFKALTEFGAPMEGLDVIVDRRTELTPFG
jgi:hypothetical protein